MWRNDREWVGTSHGLRAGDKNTYLDSFRRSGFGEPYHERFSLDRSQVISAPRAGARLSRVGRVEVYNVRRKNFQTEATDRIATHCDQTILHPCVIMAVFELNPYSR
jgi:hypothetical protein